MGLIVNKLADELSFAELLTQLDIESLGCAEIAYILAARRDRARICFALRRIQPRRHDRGRRRHGADGNHRYLARHRAEPGPRKVFAGPRLCRLGARQLDGEIQQNAWPHVPATPTSPWCG